MATQRQLPTTHLIVREYDGRPHWEAKFRDCSRQIKRRVGPAWLARSGAPQAKPNGRSYKRAEWVQRRGRPAGGALSYDDAIALVPSLIAAYERTQEQATAAADGARREIERPRTFRELAQAWRASLDRKGTKPSTLVGYDAMLAEPGTAFKRGGGKRVGYMMAALGDTPVADVTTGDVESLLLTIAETGVTARTVEKHRIMVRSILNYGIRETKRALAGKDAIDGRDYGLTVNAAQVAEGPRQRSTRILVYYLPEEIEALARGLERGHHRHAQKHHQSGCNRSHRSSATAFLSTWLAE